MFIEIQTRKNAQGQTRWHVKICENIRVDGEPRKKHVRGVGVAKDEDELDYLRRLGLKIIDSEIARRNRSLSLVDASEGYDDVELPPARHVDFRKLEEEARLFEGVREVFGTLFDELFGSVLQSNCAEILKETVIARIEEPRSKRKTQSILERDCGFSTSLDSIYAMMDKLHVKIPEIKNIIISDAKRLFDEKIDIVFFDVTTLYMESVVQDNLRDFGYSKDQKFHSVQVVLALAVTAEGVPIGYKLFKGNTAETKTLVPCLDEWKQHVQIGRVIFVADRAMFNAPNLQVLHDAGYEFIVAAKLRSMPKEIKEKILNKNDYKKIAGDNEKNSIFLKTFEHTMVSKRKIKTADGEKVEIFNIPGRFVITNSAERAAKDKRDRERILEKMQKVFGSSGKAEAEKLVSNSGYKKYAKFVGKKATSIDENKVTNDEAWDGIHGLFTNAHLTEKEVLGHYSELWTIEATFRISKHDTRMRPVYHWKEERIETHIAICFMALYLVRKIQLLLNRKSINISCELLQEELHRVQASIIREKSTGFRFRLPSRMPPMATAIYSTLGIRRSLTPTPL